MILALILAIILVLIFLFFFNPASSSIIILVFIVIVTPIVAAFDKSPLVEHMYNTTGPLAPFFAYGQYLEFGNLREPHFRIVRLGPLSFLPLFQFLLLMISFSLAV